MSADSVAELWDSYHADPTRSARDRLILHYSPLVKYVAGRVAVGLPQNVEQSDLVSYGIFGLIDAIEKFDQGAASSSRPMRSPASRARSSTNCARSTGCRAPCGPKDGPSNGPSRAWRPA
jgi:hypothetical protein